MKYFLYTDVEKLNNIAFNGKTIVSRVLCMY